MEKVTTKGRGRPRKDSPVHNATGEGENAPNLDIRIGETIGTGPGPQAEPDGTGKGLSYAELVEIVLARNSHNHRISCVIHPDAEGLIMTDNFGNIRTEKGPAGYQLNNGAIVTV